MADYEKAFARLMKDEGFVLTDSVGDKGGLTFAGITRKNHKDWGGWVLIDRGETPDTEMVRKFYFHKYWQPMRGNEIVSQSVAETLFSQFVNMGDTGLKLMQTSVGVIADGKVGPKTLAAINAACRTHIATAEETLLLVYSTVNTTRYHAIGMKDKTQRKWWPGWFRRSLRIVKGR